MKSIPDNTGGESGKGYGKKQDNDIPSDKK